MDRSVARRYIAIGNRQLLASKSGDLAAGFLDDQDPRRRVPRVEIELPEAIKSTARNAGQIQRCRPSTSHPVRSQRELMVEVNIRILVPFMTRESRGDQ